MKCQLGSDFQGAGLVLFTMKLIIWGGAWRNWDRKTRKIESPVQTCGPLEQRLPTSFVAYP